MRKIDKFRGELNKLLKKYRGSIWVSGRNLRLTTRMKKRKSTTILYEDKSLGTDAYSITEKFIKA